MIPPLSDFFPESTRESFSKRNQKEGVVIRLESSFKPKPKIKRFIVFVFSNDGAFAGIVYINSNINPNIFKDTRIIKLHLEFKSKGRDYLDTDSFVDCSQINYWSKKDLYKELKKNPSIQIGEISSNDHSLIVSTLKIAFTISKKDKIMFGII